MSDSQVLVLYQVSNEYGASPSCPDGGGTSYNAFRMDRRSGVTLASVKRNCVALRNLNARGSNGYHWRVRIDEKPNTSHSSGAPSASSKGGSIPFSWWDVQDENARLPVKEATPSELKRMFAPLKKKSTEGDATAEVSKAAKGAIRSLGKAMQSVAGSGGSNYVEEDESDAPRTAVIAFKLLDIGKANQNAAMKRGGGRVREGARRARPQPAAAAPRQQPSQPRAAAPISAGAPHIPAHALHRARASSAPGVKLAPPKKAVPPVPPTANLMDFGAPAPAHPSSGAPSPLNETRAERLKREYSKKNATANRVWDDIDQRWVEAPALSGGGASSNPSTKPDSTGGAPSPGKVKGISLDANSAKGKSNTVQAAVHARVNEMKESQEKAVEEIRQRELAKKQADAEEDEVRKRLEHKLKSWSEEHGKKKHLRSLLASLHTILWPDASWKQISLADVLDDSKVKRVYHKASRVVHPDKTGHLDAEKRFIAKRAFDALTQAKTNFDDEVK